MQGSSTMFAIVLARLWACSNALGVTDYKPLSLVSFIASRFFANFETNEKI